MAKRALTLFMNQGAILTKLWRIPVIKPLRAESVILCRLCSSSSPPSEGRPEYTYEISKDSEEWKFVEWYLPQTKVPDPPAGVTAENPTASGWIPQDESKYREISYHVPRTRNHMMPIYLEQSDSSLRKYTRISHIRGDIWALDADIRSHLEEIVDQPKEGLILTQVSEPARWIRVRGVHMERIAKFLLSKGL